MSTLQQIRDGVSRAWDTLTVGWRELRELAGDALTRFHPRTPSGEAGRDGVPALHRAARWGLLAAEVTESDREVGVAIEIPGLEAGDFEIDVIDRHLVVRGEKSLSRDRAVGDYRVMERAYGRFERAIPLPAEVDEEGASASYSRGVLTVRLPKRESGRGRRIEVRPGA